MACSEDYHPDCNKLFASAKGDAPIVTVKYGLYIN